MRPSLCLAALLAVVVSGVARQQPDPHVAPGDPLPPEREKALFRLPPGFEAQLVAAEPDIQKPMNISFDDEGRLWVTDTIEYPYPVKPGTKGRDTVKVLADFGPDGKARKVTTFADGLNIPIGVLPLPGERPRDALVFSIPQILRLRDSDGDGVADKRDPFYGTFEYRDTHGLTNAFLHAFDGWVYATHGYANRSTVKGADGRAITMQSGNTYRMKADGAHVEQYTWGQVNPFGLAMDPMGYLYSSDCHSEPIYQLIRGAYYPSFGKPHDGLDFGPQMFTGYKGSTAVAGLAWYAADAYPASYKGTAFVGDVVTNQVIQFRVSWHGASPKATEHAFLDSKDRWFRPVDIKLGPDGNLYIADFYNRIIGHYEVPLDHPGRDRHRGRIWRVVYKGSGGTPAPKEGVAKASVEALVAALGHPNLTVRFQATHQLVHRGKSVVGAVEKALADADCPERQAHALWVLERLGALDEARLKEACGAKAELVRVHAARVLAERKTWTAAERNLALAGLGDGSPHVRRASAEALGLHPDKENLRPLLDLRHKVPAEDTHLLHTVRVALRNQLIPAESWKKIAAMRLGEKDAGAVADVALGVGSKEAAGFVLSHILDNSYPLHRLSAFVHHVARHGATEDVRAVVGFSRAHDPDHPAGQAALLREIDRAAQERGQPLSPEACGWAESLAGRLLASKHDGEVKLGIDLVGQMRLPGQDERLTKFAAAGAHRLAALTALANLDAVKHAETLGQALADAGLPVEGREQVALLLARANQPGTRAQLLAALPAAPARLQNSIAAALATSAEGAEALLQAVAAGKASARLLQERGVVVRLEAARIPDLKDRLTKLTAGLPPADARLNQLIAARKRGFLRSKADATKGAAVFEKHCGICHQVGGKGAKVGPQLDGIGLRGLDRLLEDTLDPNRNVDQAFRTTSLTLTSGKVVQGLLLREEGEVIVLADAQGKEVRVPKKDVEARGLSPLSPMPANVNDQVPEADFYHLLAYLLAQKPAKR
jgi:putative heme-binding domain-containing protein